MSHLDEDALAGAAMGDALAPDQLAHLAGCADCSATLDELRSIAERAAALDGPPTLLTPPPRVWEAVRAQVDADREPAVDVDAETPWAARSARRRALPWLAAAAAAVIVGGVGVALWTSRAPDPTVVASTELVFLEDESPAGTARVERTPDGNEVLVVSTTVPAVGDADLEVWLIDPNIEGMVSLGFLTEPEATFAIPAGYDVAEFPIVDVSVEPRDGVPAHSGDSVTRGVLEAGEA